MSLLPRYRQQILQQRVRVIREAIEYATTITSLGEIQAVIAGALSKLVILENDPELNWSQRTRREETVTDSRAALEERASELFPSKDWFGTPQEVAREIADFVEQESSSLKLLLSAMCRGKAEVWRMAKSISVGQISFPVELDSSGIPVLTPEIIEALKNTR